MESIELGPHMVFCQKWEERERGWGVRPSGFTLHTSIEARDRFVQAHWDSLPDEVPDEYDCPSGSPYPVGVSAKVHEEVKVAGSGKWYLSNDYPGCGGLNGWMVK